MLETRMGQLKYSDSEDFLVNIVKDFLFLKNSHTRKESAGMFWYSSTAEHLAFFGVPAAFTLTSVRLSA